MNYADIPVGERIKYAAEYTLILIDNPANTPGNIIAELATTFILTDEQAAEAYLLSQKKFAKEYKESGKAKAQHNIILIVVLFVIGVFYLLLASDTGFSSFSIMGILYLVGILGVFSLIINNVSENILLRHPHLKYHKKHIIPQLLPATFLCFFALWCQYLFGSIVNKEDIVVKPLVLSAKIERQETGGKSRQYYYNFSAVGYEKKFRFYHSDYVFADTLPDFKNYDIEDTVHVQILKEDIEDLNKESFFSKSNKIFGMEINGNSIINYENRRARIIKSREKWLVIATFAFAGNLLLTLLLINHKRRQYAQATN